VSTSQRAYFCVMNETLTLVAVRWKAASGCLLEALDNGGFPCAIVTHNESQGTAELQNLFIVWAEASDTRDEQPFNGCHHDRWSSRRSDWHEVRAVIQYSLIELYSVTRVPPFKATISKAMHLLQCYCAYFVCCAFVYTCPSAGQHLWAMLAWA
jgi:hypothetical protein